MTRPSTRAAIHALRKHHDQAQERARQKAHRRPGTNPGCRRNRQGVPSSRTETSRANRRLHLGPGCVACRTALCAAGHEWSLAHNGRPVHPRALDWGKSLGLATGAAFGHQGIVRRAFRSSRIAGGNDFSNFPPRFPSISPCPRLRLLQKPFSVPVSSTQCAGAKRSWTSSLRSPAAR